MPLTDLVRHFNAAGMAPDSTLYPEGGRVAAWHRGLRLRSLFQPVVNLGSGRVVGHLASLVATDENGETLDWAAVFAREQAGDAVVGLDRLIRTLHALNFLGQRRHAGGTLHLAIHHRHLLAVSGGHGLVFEAILKRCGLGPEDIVLHLTGNAAADPGRLAVAVSGYRERGYQLALEGVGNDGPGRLQLLALRPEIVVVPGVPENPGWPAWVEAIEAIGGVALVADIGAPGQRLAAIAAGARLATGGLFGSPRPECRATHSPAGVAYNPSPLPPGAHP